MNRKTFLTVLTFAFVVLVGFCIQRFLEKIWWGPASQMSIALGIPIFDYYFYRFLKKHQRAIYKRLRIIAPSIGLVASSALIGNAFMSFSPIQSVALRSLSSGAIGLFISLAFWYVAKLIAAKQESKANQHYGSHV